MRRRGFTLIELMVVIAILLLLIGMLFLGLKQVTGPAQQSSTGSSLQTAKTMFSEYEQATHLSKTLPVIPPVSPPSTFWNIEVVLAPPTVPPVLGPNSIIAQSGGMNSTSGVGYNAVANTITLMQALISMPNSEKLYHSLSTQKAKVFQLSSTVSGPVLLDSYGNVVVFVPSGGLKNVIYSAQPGVLYVVTSTGKHPLPYTQVDADRPFFVSAGPDGDLSTGDDNLYSFEN